MKTIYKAVIISALGLGTMASAQAQDAYLGFNDAGGTGMDYVIDLGALSQFTSTAVLNLSSDFSAGSFSSAFGSTPDANVAAGFVGQNTISSVKNVFESYAGGTPAGVLPLGTPTTTQFNSTFAAVSAISTGVYSSGNPSGATPGGWSASVDYSTSLVGGIGAPSVGANTGNPEGALSSGAIVLAVYDATETGSGRNASTSAFTEVGTLTVDTIGDTISFTGAAVPEPTTYGLLGGAGLLIISLRHKLGRKQA